MTAQDPRRAPRPRNRASSFSALALSGEADAETLALKPLIGRRTLVDKVKLASPNISLKEVAA